jgi:DNA-binding response OmpR family regulator
VRRVLIIDDEQMIRELLERALNRVHFRVDTAENGPGGIAKFDRDRFDLVITDIRMPGMDGNEIAHYIKRSRSRSTPVIGVSGTPWLARDDAFDEVLLKPFSINALIEKACSLTRFYPSA